MKRRRSLPIVMLAVLAVAAAIAATMLSGSSNTLPNTGGKAFPALAAHAGDAARIEIATSKETYALLKEGADWVLPGKAGYPAETGKVQAFLATLGDMDLLEQKTADPARYADLDLGDPGSGGGAGKAVKILDAGGQPLAAAIFGKSAPSLGRVGGGLYLRRTGERQSWLTNGLPVVPDTASHWMDRTLFDLSDASAIKTAIIAGADGKPVVTAFRDKAADVDFSIRQGLPGKPDSARIDGLGATPVSLQFEDVRAAVAGAKPFRTVTFERFDGGSYRLALYTIGREIWVAASETGSDAAKFDTVHAKYLFKLPAYRMPVLQAGPDDFVIHNDADPKGAAHPVAHP